MGEELDDGEGLPRGPEEGVEAGGVEVDGGVPLRRAGPLADAERPEGVRPSRGGGEEEEEDGDGAEGEEARRGSHGSRLAGSLPVVGPGSAIRFGHHLRAAEAKLCGGGRIRLGNSSLRLGLGGKLWVITPAIREVITPYRGRWTWAGAWEHCSWLAEEWAQTGG